MGAAERIEWQSEHPAHLECVHPSAGIDDVAEGLKWWGVCPAFHWELHPCGGVENQAEPANDNARRLTLVARHNVPQSFFPHARERLERKRKETSPRQGEAQLAQRSEQAGGWGLTKYRFTGKEEDVEVGLQYFGKRFLNPLLGRWVSADPLNVHAGGGDWNLYAYVSGKILASVDPLGLDDKDAIEVNTAPEGVSEGSYFFVAEGKGTQSFSSRAELDTAAGELGVAVFKYNPAAEHSLEKAQSIEQAQHFFDALKEDQGSCSGMGVCGTAQKGQASIQGELDLTDGISQADGAISEQSLGEEGGEKDGSVGGGCQSCEGSDVKQVVVTGIKAGMAAIGQLGEQALKWFRQVKIYRGARPGEVPDFTPRVDYKVDKGTGHVKDSHGVSVFDNPGSVEAKGLVPHEVDQRTIPDFLQIQQRGKDPAHHEITPKPGANLTPEEFVEACKGIHCK